MLLVLLHVIWINIHWTHLMKITEQWCNAIIANNSYHIDLRFICSFYAIHHVILVHILALFYTMIQMWQAYFVAIPMNLRIFFLNTNDIDCTRSMTRCTKCKRLNSSKICNIHIRELSQKKNKECAIERLQYLKAVHNTVLHMAVDVITVKSCTSHDESRSHFIKLIFFIVIIAHISKQYRYGAPFGTVSVRIVLLLTLPFISIVFCLEGNVSILNSGNQQFWQ